MLIDGESNQVFVSRKVYNKYIEHPEELDPNLKIILDKIDYNNFVLEQGDFKFRYGNIDWPKIIKGKNGTIVLKCSYGATTEFILFDNNNDIVVKKELENKDFDRLPGDSFDYFIDDNNILIPEIGNSFFDCNLNHYQFIEGKMSPGEWFFRQKFEEVSSIKSHRNSLKQKVISINNKLYNYDMCKILNNDFKYIYSKASNLLEDFKIEDNEREFFYSLADIIKNEKVTIGMNYLQADEDIYHYEFDGSNEKLGAIVFAKLDGNGRIIGDTLYAYYPFNMEIKRYGPYDIDFQDKTYIEKIDYIKNCLNSETISENKKRKEEFKIYEKMKEWL